MMRSILATTACSLVMGASWACSSSPSSSTSGPLSDAGDEAFSTSAPAAEYTENNPIDAPPGASALGAIAVDANSGVLYVASGTSIFRGSATTNASLAPFVDLASAGFSSVSTMRVANSGDLIVAASDRVVRVTAGGNIAKVVPISLPFASAGFGLAGLAISPDGQTLFAVEGGGGSPGSHGTNVAHVARFDLQSFDAGAPPPPSDDGGGQDASDAGSSTDAGFDDGGGNSGAQGSLAPAEVFEVGPPFEIVPSTTAGFNAAAPFVSLDGTLLYVPHVVLRNVFAVTVSAPHTVSILDSDSLNRSVTASSLEANKLLVESAVFDQTVPVFRMKDDMTASFLVEIPIGLSPGAVASYQSRVFVVMSSGFGGLVGGPATVDGGFSFGDGGFPFGDGGFPGGGGPGAGDAGALPIRVFDLKVGP